MVQLERGMLIVSIDVDVGNKEVAIVNRKNRGYPSVYKSISDYRIGEIESMAIPIFVEMFNDLGIPVTFAIRGQLVDVDESILKLLLGSAVRHDIGAHGYYHREFKSLSHDEAERELEMISVGMKRFRIIPRSFVFPRNSVAHLDLLEKYGYKCYRSYGTFVNDCMRIEKQGLLYDVHPSLCLDRWSNPRFLQKMLDVSIAKKLPFHVWLHLWQFGETEEAVHKTIEKIFFPFLSYAKRKEDRDVVSFETMLSAALKVESNLKDYGALACSAR
jgi:peptidoglycan/xylan/chitin deacetylase (PgdA/CDA1 family)